MIPDLADSIAALCRRYRVETLYAFGSRAQEVARKIRSGEPVPAQAGSDVDIGVLPRLGVKFDVRDTVRLMAGLEDLLGVGRVDLVVLPAAPPFLAVEIIRGEVLYEGDSGRTAEYELYVLRKAGDLAPFERERIEQVLTGTAV